MMSDMTVQLAEFDGICRKMSVMTNATGRALVGDFVRDEIARQAISQDEAANKAGLARDTMSRVIRGVPTVSRVTLRRVEGALGLPRYLLDYIERGDVDRIKKVEMDADLKRSIVDMVA